MPADVFRGSALTEQPFEAAGGANMCGDIAAVLAKLDPDKRGMLDYRRLTLLLARLDPQWQLTETDTEKMMHAAGAVDGKTIHCKPFCEWLYADPAPSARCAGGKLSGNASNRPSGKAGGRPRSTPPGPPPKAKAKPKDRAKSHGAPKTKCGGVSLADAIARQKTELRVVESTAADNAGALGARDPAVVAAEEKERPGLLAAMYKLAVSTKLGIVDASMVAGHGTALATSPTLPLDEVLGRGRFASVVLAHVATAGNPSVLVAAKRFASGGSAGVPVSALRAARREIEAISAVGLHANVVELLGVVLPPLSLEAAAGELSLPSLQLLLSVSAGSLAAFLKDAVTWRSVGTGGQIGLLADVARALAALHTVAFAHLDLKSHNVLVDPRPSADGGYIAKLCDFGSAHAVGTDKPQPEGTSGWTAPEILSEESIVSADLRPADVFSMAVVIWEVLSGPTAVHPLSGLAGDDYCDALTAGRRPEFSDHACQEEIGLAAKCWEFDVAKRPPINSVLEHLERRQICVAQNVCVDVFMMIGHL